YASDMVRGPGNDLFLSDGLVGMIMRVSPSTGAASVFVSSTQSGELRGGNALRFLPDGTLLAASSTNDRIVEFTTTGQLVGTLVTSGTGGLDFPEGMCVASDGRLYVASRDTNAVLRYERTTGAFAGVFATTGLVQPVDVVVMPEAPPNRAPIADAGADVSRVEGQLVPLSGSGTDPDFDPVT